MARHGFASVWFGLRTRSFGRGGRRMGVNAVLPFGGIMNRERGENRLGVGRCGGMYRAR